MSKDPINVVIVDKDKEFYKFIFDCINSEKNDSINIELLTCSSLNESLKNVNIFIISNDSCDQISLIDQIREFNENSEIFIATDNEDPAFLKRLISKRITGIIDKKDKDCSSLIETIEKTEQTKFAINYIKNQIKKIAI